MQILTSILIVLALSVGILYLCLHIRLPTIVGYLLTGIIAGPYGFGLVHDVHLVDVLAEMGVILLLFTIGLEFSLSSLRQVRYQALLGGSLQVLMTIGMVIPIAFQFTVGLEQAVFMGFLVALSSTAVVLKLLQERAEIEAPHGRGALAILIFQDLAVVPMLLVLPLLAHTGEVSLAQSVFTLLKAGAIVGIILFSASKIMPLLLFQIVRTRNRELFLVSIVVLCFSVAWLTSAAGLSLALGAFLAGLIISESEYSHQALASILPFRDLFTSFFFISIGMSLNMGFVAENLLVVAESTLFVLVLKTLIISGIGIVIGYPLRTSLMLGLALCQVGEFSFILAKAGQGLGLLNPYNYQIFLSFSVLTMMATPFAIAYSSKCAEACERLPLPSWLKYRHMRSCSNLASEFDSALQGHLIIIGYGRAGQYLAQAAFNWSIPHAVIEMNPRTVRQEKEKGIPVFFGDATHEAILETVRIHRARVAVVVISDPAATRRITQLCRELNPSLFIIARSRFFHEQKELSRLGANVVISEEFEAALEISNRLLNYYYVPQEEIETFLQNIRAEGYEALRKHLLDVRSVCELELPNVDIQRIRVQAGSPAEGESILDLGLRKNYGVTLLAIRREREVISNPKPDVRFRSGDVLLIVGTTRDLRRVAPIFTEKQQ